LVGDARPPLLRAAGDRGRPVDRRVVDLDDLVDAVHELRERLELRPLVVRDADRNADVDGFADAGHLDLLAGEKAGDNGTPTGQTRWASCRSVRPARLPCGSRPTGDWAWA